MSEQALRDMHVAPKRIQLPNEVGINLGNKAGLTRWNTVCSELKETDYTNLRVSKLLTESMHCTKTLKI